MIHPPCPYVTAASNVPLSIDPICDRIDTADTVLYFARLHFLGKAFSFGNENQTLSASSVNGCSFIPSSTARSFTRLCISSETRRGRVLFMPVQNTEAQNERKGIFSEFHYLFDSPISGWLSCGVLKILVAVDPGKSGGIAVALGSFSVSVYPMPDTEGGVLNLLQAIADESGAEPLRAVVEEVGGYLGESQPASRAFEFGRGFGFLLGVLQALGARVELVRPQAWQKALGLGSSGRTKPRHGASDEEKKSVRQFNARAKAEWKKKLKQKAEQLYPGLDVTLKTCDSLLLLEFAKRTDQAGGGSPL